MVDLMGQYRKIKDQIDKNLINCIESGRFVNGPIVSDFCNNLSKYLNSVDKVFFRISNFIKTKNGGLKSKVRKFNYTRLS